MSVPMPIVFRFMPLMRGLCREIREEIHGVRNKKPRPSDKG